jgi:hypothetical protein
MVPSLALQVTRVSDVPVSVATKLAVAPVVTVTVLGDMEMVSGTGAWLTLIVAEADAVPSAVAVAVTV